MSCARAPIVPVRSRGEAGSAYIVVLLVLVILTIFGIALSLITQTESQVGSNERTLNRVFYAADAGIELAIAQAVGDRRPRARRPSSTPTAARRSWGASWSWAREVDVSAFHPILGDRVPPLRSQQRRHLRRQGLLQGQPCRHVARDPLRDHERRRHQDADRPEDA